jgi:signal transduction histidine kinase
MRTPASLRTILATLTVLATVLALLVAGALVGLTRILHRTTAMSGDAVESVRLAEEAELDLLLHERERDPIARRERANDLRVHLSRAQRYIESPDEAEAVEEAMAEVDAYLAAARDPARSAAERADHHAAAFGALERLVTLNVAAAYAARRDAARWNRVASVIGVGAGLLLFVVAGALLMWLRGRAFAPIIGLASAMERFGRGDRDARAPERGARELRDACVRFNELASILVAQRSAQVAFLGGVAHDLRNPLAALKLSVATLGAGEAKAPRFRHALERIDRQLARMERMLGDFLDVSKIEAGTLELRVSVHDGRRLVVEAAELFESNAAGHTLHVIVPDKPVPILGDYLRLEQVVTNLVSNAIKYSPSGSRVQIALSAYEDVAELRVTDEGIGMSAEDQTKLFEPFRRLGLSRETVPGVGLGLFVVRKIVEAHRGWIEVESAPGRGSTFRIYLPLAGPSVEPIDRPGPDLRPEEHPGHP